MKLRTGSGSVSRLYPDSSNRSLPVLKGIFTKWDSVFATSGTATRGTRPRKSPRGAVTDS